MATARSRSAHDMPLMPWNKKKKPHNHKAVGFHQIKSGAALAAYFYPGGGPLGLRFLLSFATSLTTFQSPAGGLIPPTHLNSGHPIPSFRKNMSTSLKYTSVADLLERYQTEDPKESEDLQACRELLRAGNGAFSRDHFEPGHFTASAFVVDKSTEETLLIFHGKLSRWLQPGGHFEPGDADLIAAAQREVEEETGAQDLQIVSPLFDVDIHVIPGRKGDPAHRHFDLRVLFSTGNREIAHGSDAHDAKWVAMDAVHQLESDESVHRALRKIPALLTSGLG